MRKVTIVEVQKNEKCKMVRNQNVEKSQNIQKRETVRKVQIVIKVEMLR